MTATPPRYRKLTWMHRSLGAMTQLWQGPDHLLHIESTGYSETYRRLYFRDIQALLLVHGNRRLYLHLALGTLLFIVLAIVTSNAGFGIGALITLGIFAPFFLWNHLLGPGCHVVIVTSVQQENVRSLCRLPKTRRILVELIPAIERAQADLLRPEVKPDEATPPPLNPSAPPELPPPLPVA